MPEVRLVLFDLDNVLCDYRRQVRLERLSAQSGRPVKAIADVLWGSGFEDRADLGHYSAAEYLAELNHKLAANLSLGQIIEARQVSMTADPEVLDLAKRVGANTQVAMLTQNSAFLADALAEIYPEAAAIFPGRCLFTCQFGRAKTETELYALVLAHLGVRAAAETLFIDDLQEFTDCAAAAGLQTHKFSTAEALAADLGRLKLI